MSTTQQIRQRLMERGVNMKHVLKAAKLIQRAMANRECGIPYGTGINFGTNNGGDSDDEYEVATPRSIPMSEEMELSGIYGGGPGHGGPGNHCRHFMEQDLWPPCNRYLTIELLTAPSVKTDPDYPFLLLDTKTMNVSLIGGGSSQDLMSELMQLVRCVRLCITISNSTTSANIDTTRIYFNMIVLPLDENVNPYELGINAPIPDKKFISGEEIRIQLRARPNTMGAFYLQSDTESGRNNELFDCEHYGRKAVYVIMRNGTAQQTFSIVVKMELFVAQLPARAHFISASNACQPVCMRRRGDGTRLFHTTGN